MNVKVTIKGYKEMDAMELESFEKLVASVIPYYRIEAKGIASKSKRVPLI